MSNNKDYDDDEFLDLESLVLVDDETGENIECVILDTALVDEQKYLLVMEAEDLESEEPNALILKESTDDDGQPLYEFIDDDTEFEKIAECFRKASNEYELND